MRLVGEEERTRGATSECCVAAGDSIGHLAEFARSLHIEARREGDGALTVYLPGFGSLTIEEADSATLLAALWVRSTSNDWPGERSDLNELFAIVVSLVLHRHGLSTQHMLVGHPVVDLPGEIYATYLLPRQPYPTGFPTTGDGLARVQDLILHMSLTARMIAVVLEACGWDRMTEGRASQTLPAPQRMWVERLASSIGVGPDEVTFNARSSPTWLYLRAEHGLSVFRSEELCAALRAWFGHDPPALFDGPNGYVMKHNELLNFAGRSELDLGHKVLAALGDGGGAAMQILAVENRLVLLTEEHTLVLAGDASRQAAVEERERIRTRHASEHELLFDASHIRWEHQLDGGRFEELVKALLEEEPGVQWARFAGSPTEPDGGRDLLVEWDTPLVASELDPDMPQHAFRTRRVVVQCKSDAASVGIRRVTGVGDTLDHYQAGGYLLVVRSRLTRPLVDRLDQRRARGISWIEWWGADELERRLLTHRHVASRFADLLTVLD